MNFSNQLPHLQLQIQVKKRAFSKASTDHNLDALSNRFQLCQLPSCSVSNYVQENIVAQTYEECRHWHHIRVYRFQLQTNVKTFYLCEKMKELFYLLEAESILANFAGGSDIAIILVAYITEY